MPNYDLNVNLNIQKSGNGLVNLNQELDSSQTLSRTLANTMGGLLTNALSSAGRAAVQFAQDSQKAFSDFDTDFRQILTLIPNMSAEMKDELAQDALDIGKEIGRLPDEVLPSLYQALSLGIPQDNIFEAVEVASRAARAGNAELETTLITGQSIINAYGEGVYDLEEVYDILFTTVKNGAVTFDEINTGMSAITSVAGEAHVPLEDIGAAIVTMTKQGDSFGEVSELMSNVLGQLAIEGSTAGAAFKELAGVSFVAFMDQGNSFADALTVMDEAAKASGQSLLNMVGGSSPFFRDIQAARGLVELTGKHLEEFQEISVETANAAGAMNEAYGETAGGMAMAEQQAAATTAELQIQLGEAMEPLTRAWLELKVAMAETGSSFLTQGDAAAKARAELEAMGLSGRDLNNVMKSVTMATEAGRPSWADTDVIMQRAAAATDLVAAGFEGTRKEMDLLIPAHIEAAQKAQLMAQHQEELAAATAATAAAQAQARTEAFAFNDSMQVTAGGISNVATQLLNVTEVLDGDTLRFEQVDGEIGTLRFRNINTAEIDHGDGVMPFGTEALEFTQNWVENNPIEIEAGLSRESYGRIIASVPDLEEALIREGLAIPLPATLSEDPEKAAQFQALVMEAAEAGVGMFEDQELAARILGGELVDLGVYYEEMAADQAQLKAAFAATAGPIDELIDAQQELADAQGDSAADAEARVVAAQEAIQQSYRDTALAAMEAALAGEAGGFEKFLALQIELGNITQEAADTRLEMANMTIAAEELGSSTEFLALNTEQQATALDLLAEGYVTTAAEAIAYAESYETRTNPALAVAVDSATFFNDELDRTIDRGYAAGDSLEAANSGLDSMDESATNAGNRLGGVSSGLENAGGAAVTAAGQIRDVGNAISEIPAEKTITITVNTNRVESFSEYVENSGEYGNRRAGGGPVSSSETYLVGEEGPELFVPQESGYIIPAPQTNKILSQTNTAVPQYTINIDARGSLDPAAVEAAAYRAAERAMNEAARRGAALARSR